MWVLGSPEGFPYKKRDTEPQREEAVKTEADGEAAQEPGNPGAGRGRRDPPPEPVEGVQPGTPDLRLPAPEVGEKERLSVKPPGLQCFGLDAPDPSMVTLAGLNTWSALL